MVMLGHTREGTVEGDGEDVQTVLGPWYSKRVVLSVTNVVITNVGSGFNQEAYKRMSDFLVRIFMISRATQ